MDMAGDGRDVGGQSGYGTSAAFVAAPGRERLIRRKDAKDECDTDGGGKPYAEGPHSPPRTIPTRLAP